MTFALPHLLWLGLVPVALLVWEITRRRHDAAATHPHILRAEAGNHRLKLAAAAAGAARRHRVRPWLCAGLLLSVVALARPQWGRVDEPVFDQAREILIAIDLSRSMLTPDVRPSRLDRAKLLVQSLLEKLNGERIGLVVFSGTAFLQSPLSADYEILREFLPALNPEFLPEGGTNYRALIDTALSAFGTSGSADRFLIVLSDGEATEENWRERLPELKTKGIRVLGLGVGTAEGAMIPDGSGGFVKDERGAVVLSKLEPATLRELAETTNGVYQDASAWIDLAALIDSTIATGQKGEFLEKNSVRLVERFQWPLALGLWCLLVSLYYEFPVRPRPRQLTLSPANEPTRDPPPLSAVPPSTPAPSITTVAILLLLVPATLLPVRSAHAAEKAAPPAESAPLARIVTRLATTPQRTARDWAEFARETVTWGTRLQSSQQAVPEGPVRDALAAVELGSKQDPKTTDWPKLRQELEALLKKPDDQQQQQQQQQNQQDQQKQDQSQQDQQKQDQSKQDSSSEPQKQDKSQQQKQSEKDNASQQNQQDQQKSDGQKQSPESAFGDMDKKEEPPPPPPEETQKVGGAPQKKDGPPPPTDPSLALPLQKLDQLKNQDSPAELFRLMEAEKDQTPRKPKKDW